MFTSKRLPEFDILRGLAITAVVVIHATVHSEETINAGHSELLTSLLLEITRFGVPAFLVMAGFFWTKQEREMDRSVNLFLRRIEKVAIPYLVWSVTYYALMWWTGDAHRANHSVAVVFLIKLATGTVTIDFYFLVLIMQFYIVSSLGACTSRWRSYFWSFAILLHVGFSGSHYILLFSDWGYPGYLVEAYERSFFAGWAAYYAFGCWLAYNYESVSKWARVNRLWLGILVLLSLCLAFMEYKILFVVSKNDALHPADWMLMTNVYALAMLLWILSLAPERVPFSGGLQRLGLWSFAIYLLHEPLLGMIAREAKPLTQFLAVPVLSYVLALTLIGLGLPLIMVVLLKASLGYRWAGMLVGPLRFGSSKEALLKAES